MLKAGSKIKVIKASYGWGNVIRNDIGVVRSVDKDNSVYCVNVMGKSFNWSCKDGDITYLRPKVNKTHHATTFVEAYAKYINARLKSTSDNMGTSTRANLTAISKTLTPPDSEVMDKLSKMVTGLTYYPDEYCITFTTNPCVINYRLRSGNIIDVPVGYFTVKINFRSWHTEIRQQVEGLKIDGEYDHPHVSCSSPCWGSYDSVIYAALKNCDIPTAISTTLDFLNSCDKNGWYRSVLFWMNETQRQKAELQDVCTRCEYVECECDHCSRCDRYGDDCHCRFCDHCDAYEEECECLRCPNSWDAMDDDTFPDTFCMGCENFCRNVTRNQWECHWTGYTNPHISAPLECFMPTPSEITSGRFRTMDAKGTMTDHPNVVIENERQRAQMMRAGLSLDEAVNVPQPHPEPQQVVSNDHIHWDDIIEQPQWRRTYGTGTIATNSDTSDETDNNTR